MILLSWRGADGRCYQAAPNEEDLKLLRRYFGGPEHVSAFEMDRYRHEVGFDSVWTVPPEHAVPSRVQQVN